MRLSLVSAVISKQSGNEERSTISEWIARDLERGWQAFEYAAAIVVGDGRELAVHGLWRADHLAAISLADRLMAEADAEDGDFGTGLFNEV